MSRATPHSLVPYLARGFLRRLVSGCSGGLVVLLWRVFLSLTERRPAEILVVEGWIGRDGVRAAATEFERGVYRYVVTSGGVSNPRGGQRVAGVMPRARSRS